jgi:acetolactate synthase-1/2/3 large subunit
LREPWAGRAFASPIRRALSDALRAGLEKTITPTVINIVTTRDPARMLPGVDNRTLKIAKGDRPA